MILVAGGTGVLGSRLVASLAASGHRVRVLTRDPARGADLPSGIDLCPGDARDPDSARRAVRGAEVVISAIHGFAGVQPQGPVAVDRRGNANLIGAAASAGASHFVLTSIFGAAPDHPLGLWRAKHAAEQALRGSGLAWTIVRPTAFMETWITTLAGPIRAKGTSLVFGRGENPINFVSAADVAAVIAAALTDPAMRGATAEVAGPEDLTLTQACGAVMDALGRRCPVRHVPRPMMRLSALTLFPFRPAFARLAQAGVYMDTADMTASAASRPAPNPDGAVRPLRTFGEVARELLAAAGPARAA